MTPTTTQQEEVHSVTSMSYNSTGISSVKCNFICDICDEYDVDYLAIQEHFKNTKTTDTYFRDKFRDYNSYVIPGYRPPGQDSGRSKAGMAQLSRKAYSVKKDRLKTHGYRLQAQILNLPSGKILWLNTYMPTDPHRMTEYDDSILREVLLEVETLLTNCTYSDVIWAGDLNWDMSRTTYFSRTMEAFMSRLGLVSLWSHHPVKQTYMHTDHKSVSVIDHFILSPRLLALVEDCGVVERGDNLSGHSPIWVTLRLGSLPVKAGSASWTPRKPSWSKASQENISHYRSDLENKLVAIKLPLFELSCEKPNCQDKSHSEHRDSFVLDILLAMVESSYTQLPLPGGSGGGGGRGQGKRLPGWSEVEPIRKQAMYWHDVWKKEKTPSSGWLHSTMVKWKRKYHYAVRRAKGKSNKVRAEKLFEASLKGDLDLLKEMKRVRSGGCSKAELPDNVAGGDGEEEIVDKFREVYSALYNSAGSQAEMLDLKQKVKELIGAESVAEVARVTGQIVKEAACSMKPGKGDVSGGFSSDAIKNAPDILFEHLAAVFRSFLFHGNMTASLLACSFLPLLKSPK